jgi:hypothetical protein
MEANYWRTRLFKATYTYRGERREVRHWSVKIQYLCRRQTFSLTSGDRQAAAAEACQLYCAIVKQGWGSLEGRPREPVRAKPTLSSDKFLNERLDTRYWEQRLIHRECTMKSGLAAERELSVRVEYGGTSHYFPLGTEDRNLAASRAKQIYDAVANGGWDLVNQKFRRELTLAFHWLDNPLTWTYSTIHTRTTVSRSAPVEAGGMANGAFSIAIAEADSGIRSALEWCINQMDGVSFQTGLVTAEEVLQHLRRTPVQLVLVSNNLPDKSGPACLEQIRNVAPSVAGLLYSVYEDSEELSRLLQEVPVPICCGGRRRQGSSSRSTRY